MTVERYRNEDPRDADEVAAAIETELQTIRPDAPVVEGTQHYALIQAFAETIADQQEQSLQEVYEAGYLTDATGPELTKKTREIGVRRRPATASTGVIQFERDSNATTDYTIPAGTVVGTGGDDTVRFETTESTTISSGTQQAKADIECTETGSVGNVGANTITVLVSGSVQGVDSVTNPNPTGDPSFTLTDGSTVQRTGQERESDSALRDRALDSTAVGGGGTAQAATLALSNLETVNSADVFSNRTDSTQNNVDPWHTEVRVFGGDVAVIADRLYEVLPLITLKTLQGGANGTKETATVDRSDLYGPIAVEITRPTETTLTIQVDVVHTDRYAGTDAATNAIVEYVGGTRTDGDTVTGLVQDEDVLVNILENHVEDVTGVEYADVTLLDADGDGLDDTTTDADGVPVYTVGPSEVATVDASDITVSETAR
jgi:uncharacterized phage protein gp47/JayE